MYNHAKIPFSDLNTTHYIINGMAKDKLKQHKYDKSRKQIEHFKPF